MCGDLLGGVGKCLQCAVHEPPLPSHSRSTTLVHTSANADDADAVHHNTLSVDVSSSR